MNYKFFKPIAIIVLFFFCWVFGGLWEVVAYAATRTQNPEHRIQTKEKGPEEKFQKTIQGIEQIIEEVGKAGSSEERKHGRERLKAKRLEIEKLDIEIKKHSHPISSSNRLKRPEFIANFL